MELEPGDVALYDDETSLDGELLDRELPREQCGMPHGLMIAGIIGAIASVIVSAPLSALCFLSIWGAGATIELNSNLGTCCCDGDTMRE
jgi:hypothetical protein